MLITEIIKENLNQRRVDSLEYPTPDKFDSDNVEPLDVEPLIKNRKSKVQSKDTGSNLTNTPVTSDKKLVNQFQKLFVDTSEKHQKSPIFNNYKKSVGGKLVNYYGGGVVTDNNVNINISAGTSAKQFSIWIKNVNEEQKNAIYDVFENSNIDFVKTKASNREISVPIPDNKKKSIESSLEYYWRVVQEIEDIGPDFKNPASSGGRGAGAKVTKGNSLEYYEFLAQNIINAWIKGQGWALSRGGGNSVGGYDQSDNQIEVGITRGGYNQWKETGRSYREHAVPCDAINNYALEMCDNVGDKLKNPRANSELYWNTVEEIAKMIFRNLVIVYCSDEERKVIDNELGYKETMPSGWDPLTGNILERFIVAKIPVYSLKNRRRVAEEE